MQGKLTLALGFAAGYVLGSKAGRQRYEEIVSQARKVAGNQTVQSTAGVLQAQASDLVDKAKSSPVVAKAKSAVGRGGDEEKTDEVSLGTTTTTTYSTPSSTTSSADLFEPAPTTGPTSPSGTNGSTP